MSQPSFHDTQGREYFPALDYARLLAIRQAGVDLGHVEQFGKTWARLLVDDLKSLDVIWIAIAGLVDGQPAAAVKLNGERLTFADWLAAMNGEALDAAREALGVAIVNFTPPLRRGTIQQSLLAVTRAHREAMAEAEQNIQTVLDERLARALQHGKLPPKLAESLATSTTAGPSARP